MSSVSLRSQYEREWAAQLEAQGITPNGSEDEARLGEALLSHRGRAQRTVTPAQALTAASRAYAKAQRLGIA